MAGPVQTTPSACRTARDSCGRQNFHPTCGSRQQQDSSAPWQTPSCFLDCPHVERHGPVGSAQPALPGARALAHNQCVKRRNRHCRHRAARIDRAHDGRSTRYPRDRLLGSQSHARADHRHPFSLCRSTAISGDSGRSPITNSTLSSSCVRCCSPRQASASIVQTSGQVSSASCSRPTARPRPR